MFYKKVLAFLFIVLFFVGCGYKPSSHYAKKEIGDKIYIDLKVNILDPKNSVLIKDAMTETMVYKLNRNIVNKKELADTILTVKLNNSTFSVIQYDQEGYAKLYKTTAVINVNYQDTKSLKSRSFDVSGTYDFAIDSGGTISDSKRFEAIKFAVTKALDEVVSKLAILSFEKRKSED